MLICIHSFRVCVCVCVYSYTQLIFIQCVLGANHSVKHVVFIHYHNILPIISWVKYYYYSHFEDKENVAFGC